SSTSMVRVGSAGDTGRTSSDRRFRRMSPSEVLTATSVAVAEEGPGPGRTRATVAGDLTGRYHGWISPPQITPPNAPLAAGSGSLPAKSQNRSSGKPLDPGRARHASITRTRPSLGRYGPLLYAVSCCGAGAIPADAARSTATTSQLGDLRRMGSSDRGDPRSKLPATI